MNTNEPDKNNTDKPTQPDWQLMSVTEIAAQNDSVAEYVELLERGNNQLTIKLGKAQAEIDKLIGKEMK